jgi:hypothetical protein
LPRTEAESSRAPVNYDLQHDFDDSTMKNPTNHSRGWFVPFELRENKVLAI